MKRYILIVALIVIAIGVGVAFLAVNFNSVSSASVMATVVNEEGGTITNPGETKCAKNSDVAYTIISNEGYHIKSLKINDEVKISESDFKTSYVYLMQKIKGKNTLTVEFGKNISVLASASNENGTVTYDKDYAYEGQNLEIKIDSKRIEGGKWLDISKLNINGINYFANASNIFTLPTGFSISNQDSLTGLRTLTIENVTEEVEVNVTFQIKVGFQFEKTGGDLHTTNYVVDKVMNLKQSDYDSLIGGSVQHFASINGKNFIGWKYKLYSGENPGIGGFGGNIGTLKSSITGINNDNNLNILLVAIYEWVWLLTERGLT